MASSGLQISSLQSLTVELPPSCVEFPPAHPSYFLVGTYNLETDEAVDEEQSGTGTGTGTGEEEGAVRVGVKKVQSRNGSIVVYQLVDGVITHVQTEAQPSAILDLHFQQLEDRTHICAAVSSTGTIAIFDFVPDRDGAPMKQLSTVRLPSIGEDVLFLSFCWHPSIKDVAAVTTSTGQVHVLRLDAAGDESYSTVCGPLISHDLEAWCVAVSPHELSPEGELNDDSRTFTLYSGGDDSTLRYTTCILDRDEAAVHSSILEVATPYPSVKVDGHGAGVTAILPLPRRVGEPAIVVTGSYDDRIRVFSIMPLHETYGVRKVKLLAESNLGGGVWRLKLIALEEGRKESATAGAGAHVGNDYERKAVMLVSCMHAGARIVELRQHGGGEWSLCVLGHFEEHRSMNYGSDFQPRPSSSASASERLRCVSTSFYDKLLCLWEFRL